MAEVAGLAIGAMGLVGLFDTAMSTFGRIETAKAYGKEYQQLAFQTSLLRLRLSRWASGVDLLGQARSKVRTPEDTQAVQDLLANIQDGIEETEKYAKRYKVKESAPPPRADDRTLATMQALIDQTSKMAISRQKNTSLTNKTRWALRDKQRFGGLIQVVGHNVTQLEELFPADEQRQIQLVKADAEQLIEATGEIDTDDNAEESLRLLAAVTTVVDSSLTQALQKALEQSRSNDDVRRHIFNHTVELTDEARVQMGDYVALGAQVIGYGATYTGTMKASGKVKVQNGNAYGGHNSPLKYVLDD